MRYLVALAMAVAVAGGSAAAPGPGTGWSRAPDLSVYGAMKLAGALGREQEILCHGRDPALVETRWRTRFAEREEWIAGTLAARYGTAPVEEAERIRVGRERCEMIGRNRWRSSTRRC